MSYFKISDIFSFGLILLKNINQLEEKEIYFLNDIEKQEDLIKQ